MPILLETLMAFILDEFYKGDEDKFTKDLFFIKEFAGNCFVVKNIIPEHCLYIVYFSDKEKCSMMLNLLNLNKKVNYAFTYAENTCYNHVGNRHFATSVRFTAKPKEELLKEEAFLDDINGIRHHYYLGNFGGKKLKSGNPDLLNMMTRFDTLRENKAYFYDEEGVHFRAGDIRDIPEQVAEIYRKFEKVLNYTVQNKTVEYQIKTAKPINKEYISIIPPLKPSVFYKHYIEKISALCSFKNFELTQNSLVYIKANVVGIEGVQTLSLSGNKCQNKTKLENSTVYFQDKELALKYCKDKRVSILKKFDKQVKKSIQELFSKEFDAYIADLKLEDDEKIEKLKKEIENKFIETAETIRKKIMADFNLDQSATLIHNDFI